MDMKAITIRGIDPSVSEKLKQAAKDEGKSVNRLLLEMINQNVGLKKGKKYTRKFNDLDHLFGKWDDTEFSEIQGIVDIQRKIDMELWK